MTRELTIKLKIWHVFIITLSIALMTATYSLILYYYDKGYYNGVQELFNYNDKPSNWITMLTIKGIAIVNGTSVTFFYEDNGKISKLDFTYDKDLGVGSTNATIYYKKNSILLPDSYNSKLNINTDIHYILEDSVGNTIFLTKVNRDE